MKIFEGNLTKPWGNETILGTTDTWKVKVLTINPGHRTSRQYHHHRDENMVCVKGQGEILIGQLTLGGLALKVGASHTIISGLPHRIVNTGEENLVIIETQTGTKVDDADVVRLEDDYGRDTAPYEYNMEQLK